eukprot:1866896-Pyramimonas_sp.AAC.1
MTRSSGARGDQISGLGSLGGGYGGEQSHTPKDPQGVGGFDGDEKKGGGPILSWLACYEFIWEVMDGTVSSLN